MILIDDWSCITQDWFTEQSTPQTPQGWLNVKRWFDEIHDLADNVQKQIFQVLKQRQQVQREKQAQLPCYSQLGQDVFAAKYFKFAKGGYFIEIGAGDGVDMSNTLLFERHLGWKGICIEPGAKFPINESTIQLSDADGTTQVAT